MLEELRIELRRVGLKMNLRKTKVIKDQSSKIEIEEVNEYTYLGHAITLNKENHEKNPIVMGCSRHTQYDTTKQEDINKLKEKSIQHM